MPARRIDALRRFLDYLDYLGEEYRSALLPRAHLEQITGGGQRDEDGLTIGETDAVSVGNDSFDSYFKFHLEIKETEPRHTQVLTNLLEQHESHRSLEGLTVHRRSV